MREIFKIVGCILLGIIVGFVLGSIGTGVFNLKWKDEIGVEPFINLFTTLVIAVFLAQSFQRLIDSRKLEQTWVIEPLMNAAKLLGEMKADFESAYRSGKPRIEILDQFVKNHRRFSNHLNDAKDLLLVLGHSTEHNHCTELQTQSTLYKQAVTDGDPNAIYSGEDQRRHDRNYNVLKKSLIEMAVKLSRKVL
jgi:hypothetical protein